jgi:hypothetical protein
MRLAARLKHSMMKDEKQKNYQEESKSLLTDLDKQKSKQQ